MTQKTTIEPKIIAFSGSQPHKSRGDWRKYLDSIELRDEVDGVKYYGAVNCNYILFPDGKLLENYGYHGWAFMNKVREIGAVKAEKEIKELYKEMKDVCEKLKTR